MSYDPTRLTDDIVLFENGALDDERTDALFQYLLDTGMVWRLQGSYGRTARTLLDARRISLNTLSA